MELSPELLSKVVDEFVSFGSYGAMKRWGEKFPDVDVRSREELRRVCDEIIAFAVPLVASIDENKWHDDLARSEFKEAILKKYPFLTVKAISGIHTQARFYASR